VQLLEADLLDRGWLLAPSLRHAFLRLDTADLTVVGSVLIADCDTLLGADQTHVPLFRRFPDRVPENTLAFFVDRILTHWFQAPEQPCVLCTATGAVQPVSPCGHLVCRACFDPADFSACPICHRQLDPDDPYLRTAPPAAAAARPAASPDRPQRLRVLHAGVDQADDVRGELLNLLARPSALAPADVDDLRLFLAAEDRTDLSWLPARIPGRETKARVLAWLLADPLPAAALDLAPPLVDTATDVLRLLVARSGGESLVNRGRLATVPRPLRRFLLALLDGFGPEQLVEDMRRHRRAWIAAGELLHPGEHARRYSAVALAFAALRNTRVDNLPDRPILAEQAAGLPHFRIRNGRVSVAVRARRVEEALAAGDVTTALAALRARPGELLRRADHLLRIAQTPDQRDAVVSALADAAPQVAPAVLLSTLGELRTRLVAHERRVFFPAGRTGTAHVVADHRPPLPAAAVASAVDTLTGEVLRRAGAGRPGRRRRRP
jgi:hypothetical protein